MLPKALITGISGLLGNNLALFFREKYNVLGLFNNNPVKISGIDVKRCDLSDKESVLHIIDHFVPNIIFHCASLTDIDQCEIFPEKADEANVTATQNLVDSLADLPASKLVYISTESVYGGQKGSFQECDQTAPYNYYGKSKLEGEHVVLKKEDSLVLRTNIFGWNIQDKTSLGEWVLNELKDGKQIKGFTDARVSTIYTCELAKIIYLSLNKELSGTYNCASKDSCSKYEFALKLAHWFGYDKDLIQPIAIAVFFSGFLLMTIQIPFPHHVSVLDVLYIQSQSSILIITGVLIFGLIFWSIHFLLEKTIKNGEIYEGLFLFLLLLISFINFALYSAATFGSFIEQFKLTSVPFMVSGLLCNILLLIFGRIQFKASFTSQLNALHDGLTNRKFWIKTLILFLFFRQLYGWLNQTDQNFLVEFIYDVTNVILPFLSFWLVLGIIVRFVKLVNHPFIFRTIALLLVIVALVPGVVFRQKNWTVGLELNRLTSRFYSSRSREILSFIGLDVERETQKKANIFKKSIKVLSKESSLVLSDVFKNSFGQKSKKRIHDYFSDPPNIFVVLSDATYARRLSVYGHSNKTSPVLEKFASEAVLFKNFYSTSSATFQGVASLFTGQYIGNYPHKLNGTRDTLCLSLKKKNYKLLLSSVITTVSFSKEKIQCQETPLLSYKGDEKEDWDKIRNAIEKSPDRPLFVYFHMLGGHDPWTLPEEELIFGNGKLDKYDALLYKADRQFGDILENLRKLSIYENSIIIFSSDHGIGLGKHLDQSSYSRTYNVNLQIPFLIKIPGVNASQVSNVYSLIDIRPSLEELLGIQNDVPLHGVSFVSEFNSSGLQKERCVFGIATYRNYFSMQCSSGIKIIYQKDYDFLDMFNSFSDPWELYSLIDQYSTENFENLAYPFIKFIAFGGKSYAFTK